MVHFHDRRDAGRRLAEALAAYRGADAVVYALPRGGVVLGEKIAKALGLPLDLVITRKIGHPASPEYAVCAITEDGAMICNEAVRASLSEAWLRDVAAQEQKEAARRRKAYLKGRGSISAKGKIAIVVDDGVATGLTLRAAVRALRAQLPKKLVAAVPVAPHDTAEVLRQEVDELVILDDAEDYLGAVGSYYDIFPQVTDGEVIALLRDLHPPAK